MESNTEPLTGHAPHGTSSSLEPATVLESVTVEFEDYVAVSGVSVEIPLGPVTVIMGLSGSGKSTLLKAAAGLVPPGAGRVRILGHYMRGMSDRQLTALRRRAGFVFQEGALWQNMSIYRNLEVPLEHQQPQLTRAQRRERIERALSGFRFPRDLSLRPSVLSAGEAKIISFLRSTITEPQLLFLDEPTTFVDRSNQNRMLDRLRALKRGGTTLVMVTHNPAVAAQLADRVIVMYSSQVIAHGTMSEVSALKDERVHEVLEEVLGEAVTYDEDLLSLLGATEP